MLRGGGGIPDSMTMLAQRCYTMVDFVGPTLENYVGPKLFFLAPYRPNVEPICWPNVRPAGRAYVGPTCWANVRLICWTNLRPMSNHTLGQHTVCQGWPNMSTNFLMAKPRLISYRQPSIFYENIYLLS